MRSEATESHQERMRGGLFGGGGERVVGRVGKAEAEVAVVASPATIGTNAQEPMKNEFHGAGATRSADQGTAAEGTNGRRGTPKYELHESTYSGPEKEISARFQQMRESLELDRKGVTWGRRGAGD
jgi:hypothetical protein